MTKRNITDNEKEYYKSIENLLKRVNAKDVASSPFLFSDRIGVQNLISRYELYKKILEIPGDIIECGVYKGNSFLLLAHLSVIFEPFSINRRLHGFDTFDGFQSIDTEKDPREATSEWFSDTNIELIQKSLDALDKVRPVNKIKRFNLVKGDITETIPQFFEKNPYTTCALLILDTDLYLPTKVALEHVIPNMPKGGVVAFDEYNYQNFPGETTALKEFIELNKIKIKKFGYESCLAYWEI